jgi:uncharacterized protein (DUF2236 family)
MFGPGSLLYESYGDRRGYLVAPVEGLLQLMHPALGRGVLDHSEFYDEPLERVLRSVPQIQGCVFDGPHAQATATQIREFHRDIKGTMADGTRYHALDPETYFWAHATFLDAIFRASDHFFARPLTHRQKAAFYREGVQWWRMYGLTMRVVPPTYEDFLEYWDHTLRNVLEPTPAAQGLVDFMRSPGAMPQPWLPAPVWRVLAPLGGQAWSRVMAGVMPPVVRETFGMRWTRANAVAFTAFNRAVAFGWPLVPQRLRIMPRARAAYRRDGRIGLRAALARNPHPATSGGELGRWPSDATAARD